jgi:hypothetical protein
VFVAALSWVPARASVTINELLASNGTQGQDEDGDFEDWIELRNLLLVPFNLRGCSLSDDPLVPAKWVFPEVIVHAHGYVVVWASAKDRLGPELHTNFRLEQAGETLSLYSPQGALLDSVTFGPQHRDTSFGRLPEGDGPFLYFPTPTPGGPNNTRALRDPPSERPEFLPPGGFFSEALEVAVSVFPPQAQVYYSVDGSEPDEASLPYTAPIAVSATTVVKAVAYLDGRRLTESDGQTYFLGVERALPALSVSLAPAYLWDPAIGIFANPQQRGREWERPAWLELYSPEGARQLGVGFGLRVHGGASRLNSAKLSMRSYFRDELGPPRLEYPLFESSPVSTFDVLVLRGGYHDSWVHFDSVQRRNATYLRDQLVRDLHRDMGQYSPYGSWAGVFLNGAYWGLYNVAERIERDNLASHFGPPDWDIVREGIVDEGDAAAWNVLLDFMRSGGLVSPARYLAAQSLLDVENFTSYVLLNVWAANRDWPDRNWTAVRPRAVPNARWRFVVWDAEQTLSDATAFLDVQEDTLARLRASGEPIAAILNSLLESPDYRIYFAQELERHLHETLAPASVVGRIDALAAKVRPEVALEAARWGAGSELEWTDAVERLRAFARERGAIVQVQVVGALGTGPAPPPVPHPLPFPRTVRVALVVADAASLTSGEAALRVRLLSRGATVTTHSAADHDAGEVASSHDLVLIAASVGAASTSADYSRFPVPHLLWQPQFLSGGREALAASGTGVSSQRGIRLRDVPHPITRGLPREALLQTVLSNSSFSFGEGEVAPGAEVLATGDSLGHHAILAVETGGTLIDGRTALARTVFLFLGDTTAAQLNAYGLTLLDQAVDWALGVEDEVAGPVFLRADVNADDKVDISDAIRALRHLFGGLGDPPCPDAMDANDDGDPDLSDVVYILNFLFRGGSEPRLPFPIAGHDRTVDGIGCGAP